MSECFILLMVLMAVSNWSLANTLPVREQEAAEANRQLMHLNFFHNGRGMILPPGFPMTKQDFGTQVGFTLTARELNQRYGIIVNKGRVAGLSNGSYQGHKVGVVGCAVCHTGRAAGFFIPGLGNKNIDIAALATTALHFQPLFTELDKIKYGGVLPKARAELLQNSLHFLKHVSYPQLANQTQGMVPIGLIRKWFYDQAGIAMDQMSRGQVKVPFLWGYGQKRRVGSFCDGVGDGLKGGWAIAVELAAGQTPQNVYEYIPKIMSAEESLAKLLPPPYPFAIDRSQAAKGEILFQNRCAHCHGTYAKDNDGIAIFAEPKLISIETVKTDTGRLDGVTPLFRSLVASNPLKDIIAFTDNEPGFFAPRLEGVWARFPYLHNGSIPTIRDLLKPASERPKRFSLKDAGDRDRFDAKSLGLKTVAMSTQENAPAKHRYIYDTSLPEHGNSGHEYKFYESLSDQDRTAIIEYLKTL